MDCPKLSVVETFASLNGEGRFAGYPACFIRLRGCNLTCSYCDTAWANAADAPCRRLSVDELCAWVAASGLAHVTITGGEPTLHAELPALVGALDTVPGVNVIEIETNGAVDLAPLFDLRDRGDLTQAVLVLTVDYKLPSSGMEAAMVAANFERVASDDVVKFVAGDRFDLETMARVVRSFALEGRTNVFVSPVFGALEPAEVAAFLLERKLARVRLQLQLHKLIWPQRDRGV